MSLFDENKEERKTRIRAAARKLVAERGYDGLTMRDLARAARVSVPTLYNLFGSKDAILCAELAASAVAMAAKLPAANAVGYYARGKTAFEIAIQQIEDAPEFYRAVMRMFMTSPESMPFRQAAEEAYIAIMAGNLAAAKSAGQVVDWAEPMIVARHMFAQYSAAFLAFSVGEIDLPTFRSAALSGICHLLAGITRGQFLDDVVKEIRALRRDPAIRPFLQTKEPHAKRRQ